MLALPNPLTKDELRELRVPIPPPRVKVPPLRPWLNSTVLLRGIPSFRGKLELIGRLVPVLSWLATWLGLGNIGGFRLDGLGFTDDLDAEVKKRQLLNIQQPVTYFRASKGFLLFLEYSHFKESYFYPGSFHYLAHVTNSKGNKMLPLGEWLPYFCMYVFPLVILKSISGILPQIIGKSQSLTPTTKQGSLWIQEEIQETILNFKQFSTNIFFFFSFLLNSDWGT